MKTHDLQCPWAVLSNLKQTEDSFSWLSTIWWHRALYQVPTFWDSVIFVLTTTTTTTTMTTTTEPITLPLAHAHGVIINAVWTWKYTEVQNLWCIEWFAFASTEVRVTNRIKVRVPLWTIITTRMYDACNCIICSSTSVPDKLTRIGNHIHRCYVQRSNYHRDTF